MEERGEPFSERFSSVQGGGAFLRLDKRTLSMSREAAPGAIPDFPVGVAPVLRMNEHRRGAGASTGIRRMALSRRSAKQIAKGHQPDVGVAFSRPGCRDRRSRSGPLWRRRS